MTKNNKARKNENGLKNQDIMEQIKIMLKDVKEKDSKSYEIILNTLNLVFKEYNTGRSLEVEDKLYDMIDSEVRFQLKLK